MYMCIYACICVYVCKCVYMCVYVCICVYMCVCAYVCMCVHTGLFIESLCQCPAPDTDLPGKKKSQNVNAL